MYSSCLRDHFFEKLKSDMQEMPSSLMLDGSNDTALSKMFLITVRVFDVNFNRVMTNSSDMNLIDGTDASTAEAMFLSVDNQLSNHDTRSDYCLAIGLDNTNANIGDHNSIKSRAKEKNGSIAIAGCPYHILDNATCKAGEVLSQVTNFDIEDHVVGLFHWFDKSSKRKSLLKKHYEFCDTDYSEITKFISTHWLCWEMCVNQKIPRLKILLPVCFWCW